MDDKVRLLARAQIAFGRPAWMGGGECLERGGARLRVGSERGPFEREAPIRVGLGSGQCGEARYVALTIGDHGGRKRRRRVLLRRLGDRTAGRKRREGAPDESCDVLGQSLGRRLGLASAQRSCLWRPFEAAGRLWLVLAGARPDWRRPLRDRAGVSRGAGLDGFQALCDFHALERRGQNDGGDGDGHQNRGGPDPHALDPPARRWIDFVDERLTPPQAPLSPFPRALAGLCVLTRPARPRRAAASPTERAT